VINHCPSFSPVLIHGDQNLDRPSSVVHNHLEHNILADTLIYEFFGEADARAQRLARAALLKLGLAPKSSRKHSEFQRELPTTPSSDMTGL
jgi:hypothetical protein